MKASLKLEAIGLNMVQDLRRMQRTIDAFIPTGRRRPDPIPSPCWVAEITGWDPRYRWKRRFLDGKTDYSESNSVGSRGVYIYYELDSGHIYEVYHRVTWGRSERYFCRVSDEGDVIRLSNEEVTTWVAENAPWA